MNILELSHEAGLTSYNLGESTTKEFVERFAALIQQEMAKEGWKSPEQSKDIQLP